MTCAAAFAPHFAPKGPAAVPYICTGKTHRKYRSGLFEADSAKGEILRQVERVRLQAQPFPLLTSLLERTGEVVSR